MFKLTMFSTSHPEEVGKSLKGLHFKESKEGFFWELDGHKFIISPFGPTENYRESYGYRVYFNGLIDGGLYLFEMSMSCFQPHITGVEFDLSVPSYTQDDWIKEFSKRPSFSSTQNVRGIFNRGEIFIVCLPNNSVNIQIRKKAKGSKLASFIKEIDSVRNEITPSEYDLFSYIGENVS